MATFWRKLKVGARLNLLLAFRGLLTIGGNVAGERTKRLESRERFVSFFQSGWFNLPVTAIPTAPESIPIWQNTRKIGLFAIFEILESGWLNKPLIFLNRKGAGYNSSALKYEFSLIKKLPF